MKLVLYSFAGSAMVLIGLIAAYVVGGARTMSLRRPWRSTRIHPEFSMLGRSLLCLSALQSWRACGLSIPGRRRATSRRPRRHRCCSPGS